MKHTRTWINIVVMKVETGVPAVHEILNNLSKEPPGLGVEIFLMAG